MFIIVTIISSVLFGVYIFGNIIGLVKGEYEDYNPLVEMAIDTETNINNISDMGDISNEITVLKLDISIYKFTN